MRSKSILKIGFVGLLTAGLVGCSGNSSSGSGGSNSQPPLLNNPDIENNASYTPGTAVSTSHVINMAVSKEDGTPTTEDHLSEIFAEYPALAMYHSELDAVTTVVRTDAGVLELWAGGEIGMALAETNGALSVMYSRSNFKADSITMGAGSGEQAQNGGALTFHISECQMEKAPEQEQQQDQDKEESTDKGQDQADKGQDVPADKGQDTPADKEQGQDKGQNQADKGQDVPADKDQDQDKEDDQICERLVVVLDLSQPEQKQEQVDKGQDKGQDQADKGQDTPADKDQDQADKGADKGQDQVDKGQNQGTDKGQETPVDKGQDKDQDQDQADKGTDKGQDKGDGTQS